MGRTVSTEASLNPKHTHSKAQKPMTQIQKAPKGTYKATPAQPGFRSGRTGTFWEAGTFRPIFSLTLWHVSRVPQNVTFLMDGIHSTLPLPDPTGETCCPPPRPLQTSEVIAQSAQDGDREEGEPAVLDEVDRALGCLLFRPMPLLAN